MKITNFDVDVHADKDLEHNLIYSLEFCSHFFASLQERYSHEFVHGLIPDIFFPNHGPHPEELTPIWKCKDEHEYKANILHFAHTIPIVLKEDPLKRDPREEERKTEYPITEIWGMYISGRNNKTPYIELYPRNIDRSTHGNDEHFKWLFTKVLIHELAHAVLDMFNYERNSGERQKVLYSSEFGRWREESMANAIVLTIIKEFGAEDFYNYALMVVRNQPAEYALGAKMPVDIHGIIDEKRCGVSNVVRKLWLDYVKGKPTTQGLEQWNDMLTEEYVYSYCGQCFDDRRLIERIVGGKLGEFKVKNKRDMNYAEFQEIFPCIKNFSGGQPAYITISNGDFKLQGASIRIYANANRYEDILKFVANTGCGEIKVYKNR